MATNPIPEESTALAPVTPIKNPVEALKPLLNKDGELDLASMNLGERMARFQEWREKNPVNAPMLEYNLLTQFPAGATLTPLPLFPKKSDAWALDKITGSKQDEGRVEPSADFLIQLANLIGVRLELESEGEVFTGGVPQYEITYRAYLMLPNGQMITTPGAEGKAQNVHNKNGIAAHLRENTRKKAKRNAIKALLGIPTSMDEADFMRPWLLMRPTFHAGVSNEVDAIIADQKAIADQSRKALYGSNPAAPKTVDVTPNEPASELSVDAMLEHIKATTTQAALDKIAVDMGEMRLTGAERKQLGDAWKAQKAFIEQVAQQDQAGF